MTEILVVWWISTHVNIKTRIRICRPSKPNTRIFKKIYMKKKTLEYSTHSISSWVHFLSVAEQSLRQLPVDMSTARQHRKSPTQFTIRYIRPPHHGHTSQYHAAPFLRFSNFRLWPWNSKVKVMGVVEGQCRTVRPVSYQLTSFSFHINQTNNSWDTAISKFDLETSKVQVMSEVKGQGHILYPVSNWCTSFSFHINQTNHSWDMAKIMFDLEKTHPTFLKEFAKITVFNRSAPKSNQVITMTSAIKL